MQDIFSQQRPPAQIITARYNHDVAVQANLYPAENRPLS
jgi:hypothetical protein